MDRTRARTGVLAGLAIAPAALLVLPGSALARPPVACFTQSPSSAALTNQTVTFNSSCTTDPDGNLSGRAWDLDNDGQFDDGTSVSVSRTFPTAGAYTVRLGVIDSRGEIATTSQTVTVGNREPTAGFSVSPASPLSGQLVTFTSTSSDPDGTIASQAWELDGTSDFDDGTGTSVSRAFATPGTRTVKLRVTDSNGATKTVSKSVTIGNRAPAVSLAHSPAQPRTNEDITFTPTASDPDGTIAGYTWDTDADGQFDDASTPTLTLSYPTPGTRTVKVRVVDDRGAAATATQSIVVEESPPPGPPGEEPPPDGGGDQGGGTQQVFDISAPIVSLPSEGEPAPAAAADPLRFLSPFPVVRLRGRTTARGAKFSLFTVRAPDGSVIDSRCKGRGCPIKRYRKKVKTRGGRASAIVHLRRFERFLLAGTDITIAVTRKGMVGKSTRIRIRKLALPVRTDRCLLPGSSRPTTCPGQP